MEGDFLREVEERIAAEREVMVEMEGLPGEDAVTSALVRKCLQWNERGDGLLYALAHRDRFVYNTTTGEMMMWGGHAWKLDKYQAHVNAVETVAELNTYEAYKVWEEMSKLDSEAEKDKRKKLAGLNKALNKRAYKLRSIAGSKNCIDYSQKIANPLSISGEAFDARPWLLGCSNGVIDLKSGKFRSGHQGDYLSRVCPVEWQGIDCSAPKWEEFLRQVFDGDVELIAYIQRLLGYMITGSTRDHVFPVFQGKGFNGKGTIVKVLKYVLGPLASAVPAEMLLEQPFARSSSAPAPDVMALKWLRLAFVSELDERRQFSYSKVKLYTGGDDLSARNPHDKYQTTFQPFFHFLLLTNGRPRCPDDDFAFWERMHLIVFPFSFVSNPDPKKPFEKKAIKDLDEQLFLEAPGILAWLVQGCLLWQKEGLNPPEKVLAATDEYRKDEDLLSGFFDSCCLIEEGATASSTQLHEAFGKWYEENVGKKIPSQRWFGKRLKKRFEDYMKTGRVWYRGIGLVYLSQKTGGGF